NGFKPVVVADGCQHRGIHAERNSRKRGPIKPKLTNKFTRDMLRIRSTPAVSRQQHLVSSTICLDASEGNVLHCGYKFNPRSQTVHNLRGLIELGHYVFVQHS